MLTVTLGALGVLLLREASDPLERALQERTRLIALIDGLLHAEDFGQDVSYRQALRTVLQQALDTDARLARRDPGGVGKEIVR